MKTAQFAKVRLIKVNDLNLTEVSLISFFHFICVTANASELFCMVHLKKNVERFLYHSNLSFQLSSCMYM